MQFRFGPEDLHQLRILVVEDDPLLALDIAEVLRLRGAEVIGPAATLDDALQALESRWIDRAVLDMNLDGEMSYAIADRLDAAGIPYVIASAYGRDALPERFQGKPRLGKPFRPEMLVGMMVEA